ncbi:MAG TPA: HAD family hydrolase [Ktedonobacteraceae bacterium]|nr:HAD family hydrolase [Ktedonobacteraceae bacterium]
MAQIHGVILDVDGTLVDSNDAHAHAWVEAMAEYGYTVAFEKVRPLIGMGGDKVLPETLHLDKDSEKGKAISQRRGEIFKERYLSALRAFPGAKELLEQMRKRGLKLAIASSAKEDELKDLLQLVGASDLVEDKTSSKDVQRSKPDPDVMHVTLKRIGLPANEVLMIGDTAYDIKAAEKVRVGTIAFRCGGWKDADLAGAIAIYDGPADLLKQYDSSPLMR